METLDDLSEQIRTDFLDTMKSINRMDDLCVRRSKVVAAYSPSKETADVLIHLPNWAKRSIPL